MVKVRNMTSSKTNKPVANQFIIESDDNKIFQSYNSIIAISKNGECEVLLDEKYWNYSNTTSKYLSKFLNESKKEIQAKINKGNYVLVNLN